MSQRLRIDRLSDIQIVSMSAVSEDALVYDTYSSVNTGEVPLMGFRPEANAGIAVSFAPQLAGAEITLDVLLELIKEVEGRVLQNYMENETPESES